MHWGYCSRSIAIGGIGLMVMAALGAPIAPADAQMMQQVDGRAGDESYPQWAKPYFSPGFGSANIQPAYTAKIGSGTVALFVDSNVPDTSVGGISGNFFSPLSVSPMPLRQDWFGASFSGPGFAGSSLANPAWKTSIYGSYKSDPGTALFNGLYTTASVGITRYATNPLGYAGLPGFTGNEVTGVRASAGLGLQLTPRITVEGSVGFIQAPAASAFMPGSAFR